jgi:hypothetical protein
VEIEDLYDLIPGFQCTAGCTECCRTIGVPSRTEVENRRIEGYLKAHGMRPKQAHSRGNCCPYVSKKGCTIYPVRPLICRLYGTSPNYLCRLGVRPVRLLHEDEEADLFHLYLSNFGI